MQTDTTVLNSDGSKTETVTDLSGGGAVLDKTIRTTSADGLSTTVQKQLSGDGTTDDHAEPSRVGSDADWATVSAGDLHVCATKTNGSLWCWGDDDTMQLGDGTNTNQPTPTRVGTDSDWQRVVGGEYHTCALKTAGTLWCWGSNEDGAAGLGEVDVQSTPKPFHHGFPLVRFAEEEPSPIMKFDCFRLPRSFHETRPPVRD